MSKTFKTMPQLLEENKRLLRDKKRLDWLDEKACWHDTAKTVMVGFDIDIAQYCDLRAAIDAAMEATK